MKSSMPAAATGTAIPPRTDMHLVMQRLPTGEPNRVVVRSAPFGEPNPVDFGALVIFSMLSRHTLLRKPVGSPDETFDPISGLQWERGAFRNTRMNYDVWTEALSWLLDGNAFRLFLPMMAPERFPTSNQEQLEQLVIPLRRVESRVCIPSHLFAQNYQRRFEIACLLDATLNADQAAVERLFEGKDDIAIKAMLSTSGIAVIAHLGIERTGTPLQMALYSHDEAMFKLLADQMDPAEVQRQCKVIFDRYEIADYNGLTRKLEADANRLCSELEAAFSRASATDITNALNRVPGTTSALQDALNRFNINLDRYVRTNPVHNPYILQRLFEIYDRLPYDWNTECLISQQAIAPAQKLSSAQWLQHYAQGIYYLGKESGAEAPRREFSCRGSTHALDIRSSSVLSRLGVDSCIDIFALAIAAQALPRWWFEPSAGTRPCRLRPGRAERAALSKLLSSKNSELGNLCSQRGLQHAERRCVVQ